MNEDSLLIENKNTLQIERGGGVSHDFRDAILGRVRKRFETTAEIYMRKFIECFKETFMAACCDRA